MADRLDLQSLLEELLDSRNVYYKPQKKTKMQYPAIRFSKKKIENVHANDSKYLMRDCYELIVISRTPDHPVIKKLLELPYCSYDRPYIAGNLYHDVLTIYY